MSDLDQYGTARSDDGTGGFDAGSARPHRLLYRLEILWIETGALFEREMEAGRGFIWLPVLFGIGVVIYFALPAEPSAPVLVAVTVILGFSVWRIRNRVALLRVLMALTTLGAGLTVTKLRTDAVAAPILAHEMTVNLSGWIAEREAAARGGVRIVLLVDGMDRVAPVDRPQKVRVTVRSKPETLAVGDAVDILARLRPPNGPAFPGGYDFARADFYRGVGAVGFAYGAAKPSDLGPAPVGIRLAMPVSHLRRGIRDRILAALPGVNGQIASALVMGDRRGIPEATQEAMRASGLGHVLAISGLHMALVAGSAYWLIRALLALSPTFAIRFPIRKWAAGAAMTIAAFYLTISGAGVSTQRAFIMLAVMLMAVMIDRRALTLRNVAIAAMIILVFEPESVLTASFQMSFAATVALVAGYEFLRDRADRASIRADMQERPIAGRVWLPVRGLLLTSLIAGMATTPFAIYHFQRAAPLTLLANLLAMPAVGLVVMPMAFFSVLLMPLGLEIIPLTIMSWGLDWVVFVADTVSNWSRGWGGVPAPSVAALILVVAGFLWLCLWRESWRIAGVVPIIAALPVIVLSPRPDILVDGSGTVAAVRGTDGLYRIIAAKDNRFVVDVWLRADADTRLATDELDRGVRCDAVGCTAELADSRLVAVGFERTAFTEDCQRADVVVSRFPAPSGCAEAAQVIDRAALRAGGSHAIYIVEERGQEPGRLRIETAYPANRRPFMAPVVK